MARTETVAAMILGDPNISAAEGAYGLGRITVNELFHYAVRRRPDALALADPANRSDIVGGKPRRLSYAAADRAIAAIAAKTPRHGAADRRRCRHSTAERRRECLDHARRAARRHDRRAFAAALAPRRCCYRAGARRRQGADHLRPHRRERPWAVRAASGGGGVFHTLCLRVRIEFTRWRRLVRGFVFRTAVRPFAAARPGAGQCSRACRRRHLRREQKGTGSGRSYPFRTFRRRACGHSRKPAGARGQYSFGAVACLVRGSKPHDSALAV